ncbi:MAG TPA: hypothetical protein VL049_22020 [Candidatus Dormibacteraeota bacterium]|nr:hypothetical protein [Candidatus Dormibacteraeota bacterium]
MMAGNERGENGRLAVLRAAQDGGPGGFDDDASTQRRDTELRRMAAFRVRETANRIATLANSAQNEDLRRELLAICQRLMKEERLLLDARD